MPITTSSVIVGVSLRKEYKSIEELYNDVDQIIAQLQHTVLRFIVKVKETDEAITVTLKYPDRFLGAWVEEIAVYEKPP